MSMGRSGLSSALWACRIGAAVFAFGAAQAMADVVVVSSNTRTYKAGQELGDSQSIQLGAQERITVLLPSNSVREVKGPFSGTVADIGKGRPSSGRDLWALVKGYFVTGGVDESRVAATRALAPTPNAAPSEDVRPWDAVPLGKPGIYCVAGNNGVRITRDSAGASQSVKLADKSMTKIASVEFAEGATVASWPAAVPVENEASYRFVASGRPPAEFTLKVLEKADLEGPDVLAALYGKGCKDQITAWLKTKAAE